MTWPAVFFDGQSASSQPVEVEFLDDAVRISPNDGAHHTWRYRRIETERLPNEARLTCKDMRDAVLILQDDAYAALIQQAPMLDAARQRQRKFTQLVIVLVLVAAAIATFVFGIMPNAATWLARKTPIEVETQIGENLASQLRLLFRPCDDAHAEALLAPTVTDFAEAADIEFDVTLRLVRTEMPNAFALPGGQMMATRGLLEVLEDDQEAFWAVVAHELAHVKNRDGMVAVYRNLGLSTLLELVTGGSGVAQQAILVGGQLSNLSYSRNQETTADETAYDILDTVGLDPAALGRGLAALIALDRDDDLEDESALEEVSAGERIPEWLGSHPDTEGRITRAFARQRDATIELPLSDDEWATVVAACENGRIEH